MKQNQAKSAADGEFIQKLRLAGIVEEPVLQWAIEESFLTGRGVQELLSERLPANEVAIYSALAEFLGVEFVELDGGEMRGDLTEYMGGVYASNNRVAPVEFSDDTLVVATSNAEKLLAASEISIDLGCHVRMVLAAPGQLQRYTRNLYGLGAGTVSQLVGNEGGTDDKSLLLNVTREVAIQEDLDTQQEASLTNFVNQILIEAVKARASDIHIEPSEHQLRVRFRIDGMLHDVPVPPAIKQLEGAIISRIKVLADLDIAEKRLTQDGQIRLRILGRPVDVRVSVLPSIYGESLVLRILDRQSQYRELTEIGMSHEMLESYCEILKQANGLILVTGPTGSGKSTTLYASLNHINSPSRKIVTVEDPVEYRLDGITQIQVKESIGLGFANILRSIVRHDPDVIMVGEIRDDVTANTALSASITGHLVLATVHTNDAITAISRLANMHLPWYMIASALKVVIAQRLVRLICPKCRQAIRDIPPEAIERYPELVGTTLYKPVGCEACRHTGYQGRTGIYEYFVVTEPIAQAIADADRTTIHRLAVEQGMIPLADAGLNLVRQGKTTLEELYRVTRDVTRA
ncbi:MAG TPA: GspE/PulE family protein [Phycisphaerae bacterium]|nr:GspE/PulE family protein [Phycisphaerae bacterium]